MNNRVCAVIVLYNPEHLDVIKKFNIKLSNQVDCIIYIDNSDKVKSEYIDFSDPVRNVIYYRNSENIGIASAQNIGINIAKNYNFEYLIFFDQDSIVSDNMVCNMVSKYVDIDKEYNIGLLSPVTINSFDDKNHKITKTNSGIKNDYLDYFEVDLAISSGSLVSMKALDSIGLMNDELFIDLVDTEWCWRARKKGFKIFKDNNTKIVHTIGEGDKRLLGKKITLSADIRYYYIVRNSIYLSLFSEYTPLKFRCKTFIYLPIKIIITSLLYKKYRTIFLYSIYGLIDGFRKNLGSYNKTRG